MEEKKMKKSIFTIVFILAAFAFSNAQKFAYVDVEYILKSVPEYDIAQTKIDDLSAQWQKELEEKFAEIDKLYKAYQADAVLLPEDIKKQRQDEIIKKEKDAKDLQKQRFGNNGDLFKKRQELVKPIQDKISEAINTISAKNGYAVVFDKSGSLTMVYVDPKYDISDQVLEQMGYRGGDKK